LSVALVMACSSSSGVKGVSWAVTCFERPHMSMPESCWESLVDEVGADPTAVGWSERDAIGEYVSDFLLNQEGGKGKKTYYSRCWHQELCSQPNSSPYSCCSNYSLRPLHCASSTQSVHAYSAVDWALDYALDSPLRSAPSSHPARTSRSAPDYFSCAPMRMHLPG
jgi:hypothetical protein